MKPLSKSSTSYPEGGRIGVDYDQGTIDINDYTFHEITAATLPNVLPPRYVLGLGDDEDQDEGSTLHPLLNANWDRLDSTTRQQLGDYLGAWDDLNEGVARQLALEFQGKVEAFWDTSSVRPPAVPPGYPQSHWDGCEIKKEPVPPALIPKLAEC